MDDEFFEEEDTSFDIPQELIDAYSTGEITAEELYEIMSYEGAGVVMSFVDDAITLSRECVAPTLLQMADSLFPLLVLCITHRIIANMLQRNDHGTRFNHGDSPSITNILQDGNIADNLLEIADCSLGFLAMHYIFGAESLLLIVYAMIGLVVLVIARDYGRHVGASLAAFTVVFTVLCEFFLVPSKEWHKIRGAQMVMAMKVISLGIDVERGMVALAPDFWAYNSYVFHVGSFVFGPWISYKEHHLRITSPIPLIDTLLVKKVALNAALMSLFIVLSTCVIPWIIADDSHKWLVAYRDAQSFRFSHYFVCYASQLTVLLTTFSTVNSEVTVCQPMSIELPRSLVDVVSCWNLPMHNWLKTYIFKTVRSFGPFTAVLATYVASSLLHGLNFQLSAVLLTLGFYTYIEYVFRDKLSTAFNACIQARACKSDCTHAYKSTHPWVIVANVLFSALAIFHLAYLGVMFDTSELSQKGYTMRHTLTKWSNLNYASHIVAAVTYFFHVLI